jgi:hypothetical protein
MGKVFLGQEEAKGYVIGWNYLMTFVFEAIFQFIDDGSILSDHQDIGILHGIPSINSSGFILPTGARRFKI